MTLTVLVLVGNSSPLTAQRGQLAPHSTIPGCFALTVKSQSDGDLTAGTVSFDTTAVIYRNQPRFRLQIIGGRSGFGAPRGTWLSAPGDSLDVIMTFIDSGLRFSFPRLASDTVAGRARWIGLSRDTLTMHPAVAIRQPQC